MFSDIENRMFDDSQCPAEKELNEDIWAEAKSNVIFSFEEKDNLDITSDAMQAKIDEEYLKLEGEYHVPNI